MVVRVESSDLAHIAYGSGYSGKPEPKGLPEGARAAYQLGADDAAAGRPRASKDAIAATAQETTDVDTDTPKPKPKAKAKAKANTNRPKTPGAATAHTAKSSGGSRAPGTRAAGQGDATPARPALTGRFSTIGDGGGLLLAFFAYPLVLAGLTKGPSGMTAWLKAKFLNKVATDSSATPSTGTGPGPNGGGVLAPGALPPGVSITPPTTKPTTPSGGSA